MGTRWRIKGAEAHPVEIRRSLQRLDVHNVVLTLSGQDIGDMTNLTSLVDGDDVVVVHDDGSGDALSTITYANLFSQLSASLSRWREIDEDDYSSTPASSSRITMSDTTQMTEGAPVKYTLSGTDYYGIVAAVSANAYIDVAGAPLSGTIQGLYVGEMEQVVQHDFFISGMYGDDVADLLSTDGKTAFRWGRGQAYVVSFSAIHDSDDTGANQPYVNVKVGGNAVSSANTNKGIQPSTSWVTNPAVSVNTSNYSVSRTSALEIACTEAGTNGDASDLTVTVVFVVE